MPEKAHESLTIEELLAIANKYYPDCMLSRDEEEIDGDTLALFIVREIKDTFDPCASVEDQLEEAARVMTRAESELHELITGLENEVYLRSEKCKKLKEYMEKEPAKSQAAADQYDRGMEQRRKHDLG